MLFASFERLATHDALTGIANHRMMQEFLGQRITEAQRGSHELGVIMIDLRRGKTTGKIMGYEGADFGVLSNFQVGAVARVLNQTSYK